MLGELSMPQTCTPAFASSRATLAVPQPYFKCAFMLQGEGLVVIHVVFIDEKVVVGADSM